MILDESQPEKSLFVIGAQVIEILQEYTHPFQITEIFDALQTHLEITFPRFILTMDWLFLTGLIQPTEDGSLIKCF